MCFHLSFCYQRKLTDEMDSEKQVSWQVQADNATI